MFYKFSHRRCFEIPKGKPLFFQDEWSSGSEAGSDEAFDVRSYRYIRSNAAAPTASSVAPPVAVLARKWRRGVSSRTTNVEGNLFQGTGESSSMTLWVRLSLQQLELHLTNFIGLSAWLLPVCFSSCLNLGIEDDTVVAWPAVSGSEPLYVTSHGRGHICLERLSWRSELLPHNLQSICMCFLFFLDGICPLHFPLSGSVNRSGCYFSDRRSAFAGRRERRWIRVHGEGRAKRSGKSAEDCKCLGGILWSWWCDLAQNLQITLRIERCKSKSEMDGIGIAFPQPDQAGFLDFG